MEEEIKKEPNYTLMRDNEIIPLAKKILLAFASIEDLAIGSNQTITSEKLAEYYKDKYTNVLIPLLLEANIKLDSIHYLFQLMLQPFQFLESVANESLNMNRNVADGEIYHVKLDTSGKPELRIMDIQNILLARNKKAKVDNSTLQSEIKEG